MNDDIRFDRRRFLTVLGATGAGAMVPGVITSADAAVPGSLFEGLDESDSETAHIEGYASASSVDIFETITFHVRNNVGGTHNLEIYRLGWYGGAGATRVLGPVTCTYVAQPNPTIDPQTGLIECRWSPTFSLTASQKWWWSSGMYVVKLTANKTGRHGYIRFVVRDDIKSFWQPQGLMFQSSVTTDQCYNAWGGKSAYYPDPTGDHQPPAAGGPAVKVSFNRPYENFHGLGIGFQWEYNMVRFLEREGYPVDYCTNIDVHRDPGLLSKYRVFLSVGHDEYWTWDMRNNLEAALARGVDMCFLGSNTSYWQIRLEKRQRAHDTVVVYRYNAKGDTFCDPYYLDSARERFTTTQWRQSPVNRPESKLIGVMYYFNSIELDTPFSDMIVQTPNHWAFAGTGLKKGDALRGLLGYEVDRIFPESSPAGIVSLCHSPTPTFEGNTGYADMAIYTAPSGALVFATGTNQWPWGLDDYRVPAKSIDPLTRTRAQRITRNVLDRMKK